MADTANEIAPIPRTGVLHGISSLYARFWRLFRVRRRYSLGVDYRPKADKNAIKLAVEVAYDKYLWDRSIGSYPVKAENRHGALQMAGDPLAVAIVAAVKTLENRFLKSELPRMEKVLREHLQDQLEWLDVKLLDLSLHRFGTASVEEKKK